MYKEVRIWMLRHHGLTFVGFDFATLKAKFFDQFLRFSLDYPAAVGGQSIKLTPDLIEFNDGIYVLSVNLFVKFINYRPY